MKLRLQVVYGICHITVWLTNGSLVRSCVSFLIAQQFMKACLSTKFECRSQIWSINWLVCCYEFLENRLPWSPISSQVHVAPRDRDCLRFLWWPEVDISKHPVIYRMKVHLFDKTSSPNCTAFWLRRVAKDFGAEFELVIASTVGTNSIHCGTFVLCRRFVGQCVWCRECESSS